MTGTMLAAVVHAKGDLRLDRVPIPDVIPGSIRIKVKSCAICGTDMRIYRKGDSRATYPVIVGHEIAGIVEAVAKDVQGPREGDRVCVAPGHGCGHCRMCLKGQPNVCVSPNPSLGYRLNGGFAEYMAVPEHIFRLGFVNRIPDELTFDQASLSEIIACCINGQSNAPVKQGETVLIMGAGPAGIIMAHLARFAGARRILMTQRSRERLELASSRFPEFIDRVMASGEEDLQSIVMEETGGEGVDVVYVCAPSAAAQEEATRLVASRGRVNLFGGLPADDNYIRIDANRLHYKEFFLSGASSSLPDGNREALRLLAQRRIDPDRLITGIFPLERIVEGFAAVENRKGIKTVIRP